VRRLRSLWHSVIGAVRGQVAFRTCDSVGRLCAANFGWPDIVNRGRIELGVRVWLDSHYAPVRLETGATGVLRIGDRTGINYGAVISAGESVSIGAGVSIAPYCVISDTPAGPAGAPPDPVVIEDGCWLATRVVVDPGAHIGRNAVISAGTHVTGTVEPNVVYGGAPPRVLRRLDSGEGPSLRPV
jgi:acetyltransferase-like isoleucine patch superfamily enzyme